MKKYQKLKKYKVEQWQSIFWPVSKNPSGSHDLRGMNLLRLTELIALDEAGNWEVTESLIPTTRKFLIKFHGGLYNPGWYVQGFTQIEVMHYIKATCHLISRKAI
ncbi:hypothetical protein Zmor_011934 [Zophobas morio]|jgi:hypothetical protein|uniref:Uncharacterized protein n=1 Tax=Zophobas morio TaxID=2755281 RepID=A0AA38HHV6_9CUCU|nr:hypothetical protein Zmor_011934 [Zophobas morio]